MYIYPPFSIPSNSIIIHILNLFHDLFKVSILAKPRKRNVSPNFPSQFKMIILNSSLIFLRSSFLTCLINLQVLFPIKKSCTLSHKKYSAMMFLNASIFKWLIFEYYEWIIQRMNWTVIFFTFASTFLLHFKYTLM